MISNFEKKTLKAISKKKETIYFVFISLAFLAIRLILFKFMSGDYVNFLGPWYKQIKHLGGIVALKKQIGNYGIPYQFVITLFTYIPIKDLYLYKLFSVIFDYVLAFYLAKLAKNTFSKANFLMVYSIALALPTVIFNSALWAQADSIYSAFLVMSLYYLISQSYGWSFALLGVAIAFKLQAIFILPFFVLIYVLKKQFSILYFGISLVTFYICNLPGLVFGRGILAPFKIYTNQAGYYDDLNMNYPNFTTLVSFVKNSNNAQLYQIIHTFLLAFALLVLIIGYMYALQKFEIELTKEKALQLAIWTFWTCVLFMPGMHERYGYVVDLLLVVLSCGDKRILPITTVSIMSSFIAYCSFLLGVSYNPYYIAYVIIFAYVIYSYFIVFSSERTSVNS